MSATDQHITPGATANAVASSAVVCDDIDRRIQRARWWRAAWINAADGERTLTRKEYKEFRSRLADRRVACCYHEMELRSHTMSAGDPTERED